MKTAEEIIAFDDRPTFPVEVPEWGPDGDNTVQVRELSPLLMDYIADSCEIPDGKGGTKRNESQYMAKIVVEGCVSPKFSPAHVEALQTKSNRAIRRLFTAIVTGKKKEEPSKPSPTLGDSATK